MSFIVNDFNDILKWTEFVSGTGTVINRSTTGFQCFLPFGGDLGDPLAVPPIPATPGDVAGLVSVQPSLLPDVSIRADALARDTRFGITKDPVLLKGITGYRLERDVQFGEVFVWTSGVEFRMPDPVPVNQTAEMRIQYTQDPDTVTWPNGRLTFYYDGVVIFEVSPKLFIITPTDPLYVFAAAYNTYSTPVPNVTATFQASGFIPPTNHILTISSSPIIDIPFQIRGNVTMSLVTPWSGSLEEGTYEIEMPSNVLVGPDTYNFSQWEDGSTNPVRLINLVADVAVESLYQLQIITGLEIHAFVNSVEVTADGLIVETGDVFQTPITLQVSPGTYTIRLTFGGITKELSTTVSDGETIRVDGQLAPPMPSFNPLLLVPVAIVLLSTLGKSK